MTYTITTTDGAVHTGAVRLPDGRGWRVGDSVFPEEYVARAHPRCYPCPDAAEFAPSDMLCKECPGLPTRLLAERGEEG